MVLTYLRYLDKNSKYRRTIFNSTILEANSIFVKMKIPYIKFFYAYLVTFTLSVTAQQIGESRPLNSLTFSPFR